MSEKLPKAGSLWVNRGDPNDRVRVVDAHAGAPGKVTFRDLDPQGRSWTFTLSAFRRGFAPESAPAKTYIVTWEYKSWPSGEWQESSQEVAGARNKAQAAFTAGADNPAFGYETADAPRRRFKVTRKRDSR